jgi:hypothetical protein
MMATLHWMLRLLHTSWGKVLVWWSLVQRRGVLRRGRPSPLQGGAG